MIPLSPVLLIASAGALLDGGASGRRPGWVAGAAALVHHAGYWSHFDHRGGRSNWPLPQTTDCAELATFAGKRGVLSDEPPRIGEIFLLWSPSKRRFVHTGIVLASDRFDVVGREPARYECLTIEGGITRTGCIGGEGLARVRRMLVPGRGDRSIRWMGLEARLTSPRRSVA